MKNRGVARCFSLVLFCLVSTFAAAAQETANNPEVIRIGHEIRTIDENLGSTAVETKLFAKGDESGVLSLYTADGRFSKLVVQLVSEKSGDVTEYYYKNGTLIYAVDACKNFGSLIRTGTLKECASISEDRYYLSNGSLVAWLSGAGPGPITLSPATTDEKKLTEKGSAIIRTASIWRAFVHSPLTDFDRFAGSYSP